MFNKEFKVGSVFKTIDKKIGIVLETRPAFHNQKYIVYLVGNKTETLLYKIRR